MGPDRPRSARRGRLLRRSGLARSRVPLHRRLRSDPGLLRYWLVVLALAATLAGLVHHALRGAEQARDGWGGTTAVWVTDRPVHAGDLLTRSARVERWPAALAPDAAVASIPADGRAAAALDPGSVVTAAVLVRGDRGEADRRTVAVPVPDARLPVREGDQVDVWATADPAALADGAPGTRRIATGAIVVSTSGGTVVLAVTSEQVPAVAEAAATATIALVGRD